MKKVSVIIPVYNVEKYVAATIKSVLSQTYENFEIIIVDDGSPDGSIGICQQFKDSRIKIIHQKNTGLAGARNTGIRHAIGDYLAFLDADDIWLPEKLEKHVHHLNNSPTVGISFCYSAFINEKGNYTGLYQKPRKLYDITPSYVLCRNPVGNGSVPVIRREVFQDIKFQDNLHGTVQDYYFDECLRRAEDIECWLRISIQTHWRHEGIPEILTLYRVTSGGLSASALKQLEALEKVVERTRCYAPDIISHCEKVAKAYHLRYTVRRLVSLGEGVTAVRLFNQALANHWQIILEEPGKTVLTGCAAYILWFIYPLRFAISKSPASA
ncbi:MAG: glycosyltransferase family 2 protein [Rivularia sp. (in: cyanobacteria)]